MPQTELDAQVAELENGRAALIARLGERREAEALVRAKVEQLRAERAGLVVAVADGDRGAVSRAEKQRADLTNALVELEDAAVLIAETQRRLDLANETLASLRDRRLLDAVERAAAARRAVDERFDAVLTELLEAARASVEAGRRMTEAVTAAGWSPAGYLAVPDFGIAAVIVNRLGAVLRRQAVPTTDADRHRFGESLATLAQNLTKGPRSAPEREDVVIEAPPAA